MDSKNIVLIGFMGTGKTSVGRILAKRLKRKFLDVDACIERKMNQKIHEIFERQGEPVFRRLEKEAILEIAQRQNAVITTGGGAVLDPDNLQALKRHGIVVALFAKPETVFSRLKAARVKRPLLKAPGMLSNIRRLMGIRRPYYERSDFQFETDTLSADQVAAAVVEAMGCESE